MEVMSIFECVCLRSPHRSILILLGLLLLTGCLQLDRRDVLPATVLGFVSLPIVILGVLVFIFVTGLLARRLDEPFMHGPGGC